VRIRLSAALRGEPCCTTSPIRSRGRPVHRSAEEIKHTLRKVAQGRPGDAECDRRRRAAVIQKRTGAPLDEADRLVGWDVIALHTGGTTLASASSRSARDSVWVRSSLMPIRLCQARAKNRVNVVSKDSTKCLSRRAKTGDALADDDSACQGSHVS
jgi:hypothetical protein